MKPQPSTTGTTHPQSNKGESSQTIQPSNTRARCVTVLLATPLFLHTAHELHPLGHRTNQVSKKNSHKMESQHPMLNRLIYDISSVPDRLAQRTLSLRGPGEESPGEAATAIGKYESAQSNP